MNARLWGEGEPVSVECDEHGRPLRFRWGSQTHQVERICNRWRVHEGWWRLPTAGEQSGWREYVKLTTTSGLLCLLGRDLQDNIWELVRLYD